MNVHTEEYKGYRIRIETDEIPENPRTEQDHIGTMVCWANNYTLGDEQPDESPDEWMKDNFSTDLMLPLYLMDHSGLSMSTGAFGCPWDSGHVGWIYVSQEDAEANWSGTAEEIREKAMACLEAEVKEYDDYLNGRIYSYVVEKDVTCDCCKHTEQEVIDECVGFYPDERGYEAYCLDEARAAADAAAEADR